MSRIVSRCGKDCGSCENVTLCDCPGCLEIIEGDWAGSCEIKKCCEDNRLEHCGLCGDFPCELLRNTAFDEEEGDDGDRLITLKRWSEEKPDKVRKTRTSIIAGFGTGAAAGAILGALSGTFASVMFACILVGTAIGLLIDIQRNR